ncbi:AMP-binding protein [Alistipes ihumii]|uniref:AMP-binding protein n=1 Tax=Alistipes ihumii TaxID=1470347 RepID=UPI00267257A3|nr:AMP-binding protein [Alistipes ihumii]
MTFNTLRELYLHSIETYGSNRCSSLYGGEKLTYDDFARRVDALTETFVAAGLGAGDKVALLSNNMPNWGVVYFTAAIHGLVIVPILPDFSGPEIDRIILHSEAKALVASDKLYTKVSKEVIAEQDLLVVRSKNLGVISHRKAAARGVVSVPRSEDLAAIIYTSGTTSEPKGVMLSHGNLCSELAMVSVLQPVYPTDIFLSILPLSHTFECSLGMLLPFMWGAQVVYLDKAPTASVLLPVLRVVRPTIMLSVPLIIEKIYKNKVLPQLSANRLMRWLYDREWGRKWLHRIAGKKLMRLFGGRIRFFGIGGAKLDPRVEQFLFEGKFPYAIGYGLTETAPVLAGVNPTMVRHQSTGPMLQGVEARLDNVNPLSGEGEIVVKGPNVMMGYYKNPEATADSFTEDGWFRTKDLGVFDADGYLYIKGRLSNMILGPSGENIYPEEIENVLNGHALVNDSLVQEDDMGKLVAIVYFNREELERKYQTVKEKLGARMEEIKKELLHYVNSKVNRFSRISVVVENQEGFEKTPTHKIKRFLYSKKHETGK